MNINKLRILIKQKINEAFEDNNILYHGSKYKFNKFDLNKINTGQHSQDFGYGLYFTSDKETAKFYTNELSNTTTPVDKYNKYILTNKDDILLGYLKQNQIISAKRRLNELINNSPNNEWKNLLNALDKVERYGFLYTVEIINPNYISKDEYIVLKHKMNLSDKEMNNILLEKGFNGIKYSINSFGINKSRNFTGEFNVIIIDDKIINIKNIEKLEFEGYLKLKI